jgi:hypothetical protein
MCRTSSCTRCARVWAACVRRRHALAWMVSEVCQAAPTTACRDMRLAGQAPAPHALWSGHQGCEVRHAFEGVLGVGPVGCTQQHPAQHAGACMSKTSNCSTQVRQRVARCQGVMLLRVWLLVVFGEGGCTVALSTACRRMRVQDSPTKCAGDRVAGVQKEACFGGVGLGGS